MFPFIKLNQKKESHQVDALTALRLAGNARFDFPLKQKKPLIQELTEKIIKPQKESTIITPANRGRKQVRTKDIENNLDETVGENREGFRLDDFNIIWWDDSIQGRFGWYLEFMLPPFCERHFSNAAIIPMGDNPVVWDYDTLAYYLRWYDAENPWG